MDVVLSLICMRCKRLLMQQKVSCNVGNTATINIDELTKFAGHCCNNPNRTAKIEVLKADIIVEASGNQD